MNSFLQSLRNLGPVRLALLGATAIGTLLVFIYITAQFSNEQMTTLFSDVSSSDGGAIVQKLEQMNIPYRASADGTRISVPDGQVGRVRLLLAEEGLPSGGGVGYEIFNKPESFGSTSFLQNVNQQRALEGELARTIRNIGGIREARVQLVLPRRELFSREANQSRASVFVKAAGGSLDREQIRAIQHLVSAAVPQLEPSRVAIVDAQGRLLASGLGQTSVSEAQSTAEEQRLAVEQRLSQRVEEILGATVGYGKVRAQVTAELDMESVTTQSETYDPEGQVARSSQSVTDEKEETSEGGSGGDNNVTVAANLPGGAANPATTAATPAAPASPTSKASRTEETTNFEISKKVQNQTRLPGSIKRISVAVVVDGTYKTEGEGKEAKEVYTPRTPDELEKFATLVRSTVGFDADRGDLVEVQNMQFTKEDLATAESGDFLGEYQDKLMRLAEIGMTALIGLVVLLPIILLVIRPLISSLGQLRQQAAEEEARMLAGGGANPQLTAPSSSALAADMAAEEEAESMIDISQVDGRVKASSLKKMGEIIDKHPEEAVAIIRQWIYAES